MAREMGHVVLEGLLGVQDNEEKRRGF